MVCFDFLISLIALPLEILIGFNTKDFFFIASLIFKIGFLSKYSILAFFIAFLANSFVFAATAKIG